MNPELLIKGGLCVSETDTQSLDIAIDKGIIVALEPECSLNAKEVIDAKGLHILPGIIDSQVHFREPGLTHKEDIYTGSLAAVTGGVTTFLEMPNTHPATTTVAALQEKIDSAKKNSWTHFGFFIGATADNLEELIAAQEIEGCAGIKIFLGSSTGSLLLNDEKALLEIFRHTTMPISIHSEDESILQARLSVRDQATSAHAHHQWRNVESALSSTKKIVALARKAQRKIHILHLSTADEAQWLQDHRDLVTMEVTPQHLTLFAPDCYDQLGTYAQMNPPIRELSHQQGLWQALQHKQIDLIGSDHAPHTKSEKDLGYPKSPSGMPGVQTLLPVMLSHMAQGRLTINDIVRLLCAQPARIFRLKDAGFIKVGARADLTFLDFSKPQTIKHEDMRSKVGWTPFDGLAYPAQITRTMIAGKNALDSVGQGQAVSRA